MQTNPYDIRLQLGYSAKITKDLLNKTVRRIAVDLGCSPQAVYRRLYQAIKERPVFEGHGIDVDYRWKVANLSGHFITKVEILVGLDLLETAYEILLEIYQPKKVQV